jgi:hypothetical protein
LGFEPVEISPLIKALLLQVKYVYLPLELGVEKFALGILIVFPVLFHKLKLMLSGIGVV